MSFVYKSTALEAPPSYASKASSSFSEDASSWSTPNIIISKNIYIGPDWSPPTLQKLKIVRLFTLYGGIVMADVLPDGTIGDNENGGSRKYWGTTQDPDELRWFKDLCEQIHDKVSQGHNVMIFVDEDCPHMEERGDVSRAFTLEEAYRIWNKEEKKPERQKDRKKIIKQHREQLKVWEAMVHTIDPMQREVIKAEWKKDFQDSRKWSRTGVAESTLDKMRPERRMPSSDSHIFTTSSSPQTAM